MKLTLTGAALGLTLALPACYDFHTVGPEDPPPLKSPLTTSVAVLYQQPVGCVNTTSRCDGPVTFQTSWLRAGDYVTLQQSSPHTWVATIRDVPVNFPGVDPYRVYAVDPYLLDTPTAGISADRLTVGGERIVKIDNPGGTREQGLIFIDANGKGRTPQ
ncbi:MAG: hypothetical protein JJE39_04135 [Vicinamibacteria bacterium]|nr:hypothetical protein [Vicinamibacteria bacterium]